MSDDLPVHDRILASAIDAAADRGIAKLSVGDVARRAGLSRQTLYRHFPTKDALVAEAVAHETLVLAAKVRRAGDGHDEPRDALEASFAMALRAAREHPLLDRLVRTEPETLLPLLLTDGGPVLATVRTIVSAVLAERAPAIGDELRQQLADMITRLLVSYAVAAPDDPPDVVAANITRLITQDLTMEVA